MMVVMEVGDPAAACLRYRAAVLGAQMRGGHWRMRALGSCSAWWPSPSSRSIRTQPPWESASSSSTTSSPKGRGIEARIERLRQSALASPSPRDRDSASTSRVDMDVARLPRCSTARSQRGGKNRDPDGDGQRPPRPTPMSSMTGKAAPLLTASSVSQHFFRRLRFGRCPWAPPASLGPTRAAWPPCRESACLGHKPTTSFSACPRTTGHYRAAHAGGWHGLFDGHKVLDRQLCLHLNLRLKLLLPPATS